MTSLEKLKWKQYDELLSDKRWKEYREKILIRDGRKCRCCGVTKGLQVHHRQYIFIKKEQRFIKPWEYPSKLLITFCKRCHIEGKEKHGEVPIKYI